MLSNSDKPPGSIEQPLAELARLRQFTGPPVEFWKAYLAAVAGLVGASRAFLIVRDAKQPERLKKLGDWSDNGHADRATQSFLQMLPDLTENSCRSGKWKEALEKERSGGPRAFALGIELPLLASQESCVAAILLANASDEQAVRSPGISGSRFRHSRGQSPVLRNSVVCMSSPPNDTNPSAWTASSLAARRARAIPEAPKPS